MSGTQQDQPGDRDTLAAEYVLGLLGRDEQRQVADALAGDVDLRQAVAAWRERLAPLVELAEPSPTSDLLWARLARDMDAAEGVPTGDGTAAVARPDRRRGAARWMVAALAGFTVAACLAAFLAGSGRVTINVQMAGAPPPVVVASLPPRPPVPPPAPARLEPVPPGPAPAAVPPVRVTPKPVLLPASQGYALALLGRAGAERPSLKLVVDAGGRVRVETLRPTAVAAGKQLDLWVWPHGDAEPTLLGPIEGLEGRLSLPSPQAIEDGTPVMVTVEPKGIINTGQQGPVLFQGQLALISG